MPKLIKKSKISKHMMMKNKINKPIIQYKKNNPIIQYKRNNPNIKYQRNNPNIKHKRNKNLKKFKILDKSLQIFFKVEIYWILSITTNINKRIKTKDNKNQIIKIQQYIIKDIKHQKCQKNPYMKIT